MTNEELAVIEARALAAKALGYERDERDGEESGEYKCPLCEYGYVDGADCPLCEDGYVDGTVYYAKEAPATIVAYGIGKGLKYAEEWVEKGPNDMLSLIAEVRRLRALEAK